MTENQEAFEKAVIKTTIENTVSTNKVCVV